MAANDIYQIRVLQLLQGQVCVNVFHYQESSSGDGNASDLYDVFTDDVWDVVRGIQSEYITTTRFEIINGNDNSDFFYQDVSSDGTYGAGLTWAVNSAYAFRSPSGGPGSRYGYKRFAGVRTGSLDSSHNGGWSDGFMTTNMYPVGVALGTFLEGAYGAYTPGIISGSFVLGATPTWERGTLGTWSANRYPSLQRTRSNYSWEVLAP